MFNFPKFAFDLNFEVFPSNEISRKIKKISTKIFLPPPKLTLD